MLQCKKRTSGGKGNFGKFIERNSKICAAGAPSEQENQHVADCLQHYLLVDEADALIHDAIIPPAKLYFSESFRPPQPDKRNAMFTDVQELINPPIKTKAQALAEDFKETVYESYWKKRVGALRDQVPSLPKGFDVYTTLGKKNPEDSLYDLIMPANPDPKIAPNLKSVGAQLNRNYCSPAFNPDRIYGHRTYQDLRGRLVKCCLSDDRVTGGDYLAKPINSIQADFKDTKDARLGIPLCPNIENVNLPQGFAFGTPKLQYTDTIVTLMTNCETNHEREFFKKCLGHLNTLRFDKHFVLSKRFERNFYSNFYLCLKHLDVCKTGWLPKQVVYNECAVKFLRFDPALLEPLLAMWKIYDGSQIEYKTFVQIMDFHQSLPDIPKIWDIPDECIDYRTTYTEMVKLGQEEDKRGRAGVPSGRYFDKDYPVTPAFCCKAIRTCLPEESDARSCLCPSVMTSVGVSHRDAYAAREPQTVRRVFEATGHKFTDEEFDAIWNEATKYHSKGWVCYNTFNKAFETVLPSKKNAYKH